MKSYLAKSRLVPLVLIFGMILLIFCGVLYNTQILNGSDYKARSLASNATAQTVEASRGIITDRRDHAIDAQHVGLELAVGIHHRSALNQNALAHGTNLRLFEMEKQRPFNHDGRNEHAAKPIQ